MNNETIERLAEETGLARLHIVDERGKEWRVMDLGRPEIERFASAIAAELQKESVPVVRVCPERDIVCGSNPKSWCAKCPNVKPTCSACNTVREPGKPGLYHTGGEGCRLAGNGKDDESCENCHGTGKGYGEVACAYCDAGKSGDSGYDLSAVIHLTHQKTQHIIKRDGHKITGFVLSHSNGEKCIVDQSAVRWFFDIADFLMMMHTVEPPPFRVPVEIDPEAKG